MSNLSTYLSEAGISQRDFAEIIGVDKGTVSRLVAGKMTPRLELAAKIQAVTGGAVKAVDWIGDHPPANGPTPAPVQAPGRKGAA